MTSIPPAGGPHGTFAPDPAAQQPQEIPTAHGLTLLIYRDRAARAARQRPLYAPGASKDARGETGGHRGAQPPQHPAGGRPA